MSEGKTLSTKIHHTLDYRAKTQAVPRYDLSDVYPQTGNRELKLSEQNRTVLEFELPPRCVNLARSKLEWTLEVENEAKAAAYAAKNIFVKTDAVSFIERVEVFTRSGVRLMDLDRQQLWSKLSNMYFQDPEQYEIEQFHSTNSVDRRFRNKQQKPWFTRTKDGESRRDIVGVRLGKEGISPFTVIPIPAATGKTVGDKDQFTQAFSLDLGHFRDSILAVDKTLFFGGQVLNIKLHIAPYNDFLYKEVAETLVVANDLNSHGDSTTEKLGTVIEATKNNVSAVKFKDLTIRCAFESNPVIIAQIKQKVMSKAGLSLFVPYTYFIEQSGVQPTGRQSMITRLNRGYGIRLHRLVTTVTPSSYATMTKVDGQAPKWETSELFELKDAATMTISAKSKVKDYYTTLNNRRLQERDIIIADADGKISLDSYNYAKSCLKGSLADGPESHLHNWCHIDSFDGYDVKSKDHINTVTGLPLSDDMQYTFHGNLNSGAQKVNITTFAVCQRSLLLKADSVTIV